jgi:hypothetical protein
MRPERAWHCGQEPQQAGKRQMQQHEGGQYVGVDGGILQDQGVDDGGAGIRKKVRRIGFVEIAAAGAESPN